MVKSLFSNCLEMFVFGTNWQTRHPRLANWHEQPQKMDKSLCQATMSCGKYCTTLQIGIDFVGDLEDSKSTLGGILCIFGSRTFVHMSWMGKKQTSVSHSSSESEIISLDAGVRMDCMPALDFWDLDDSVTPTVGAGRTPTVHGGPYAGRP